jgi:hypothetical protein
MIMNTTNSKTQAGLKVTSGVKGGGFNGGGPMPLGNHNRRLAVLSVKSNVKAGTDGIVLSNHNRKALSLAVKTSIKAGAEGIVLSNHNRRLA